MAKRSEGDIAPPIRAFLGRGPSGGVITARQVFGRHPIEALAHALSTKERKLKSDVASVAT